ncbi:DUF6894 family protein [Bradyrhizobium sp. AZCC 1578]|uniref:DUF6894 family protein n=1 Tax=Bradyrhizobium sp. AZCC 1578 TaxID=3117027 RepID=UPI003FA5F946
MYHDRAELDKESEELPDRQAAWREATVTAGQIIRDLDGRLCPGKDWKSPTNSQIRCTSFTSAPTNPDRAEDRSAISGAAIQATSASVR